MTLEQFIELRATPDEAAFQTAFDIRPVTVHGNTISVNVERSLLQPNDNPAEVNAWIETNATIAIDSNGDGVERAVGGPLSGHWKWVRRIAHMSGEVTILHA
jgi:hypothetical protein